MTARRRNRLGGRTALLFTAVSAATTWVALAGWGGFVTDPSSFLVRSALLAGALAATGALGRWRALPAPVTIAVQVVVAAVGVCWAVAGSPVPTPSTLAEAATALRDAMHSARTYAAPIGPSAPSVTPLLLLGSASFLLLVDAVACTLRRVPLAGLGLLAVYAVPGSLTASPPALLSFLGTAAGFLLLLHLDARESLQRWGRPVPAGDEGRAARPRPRWRPARDGGLPVGVAALALALVVPPLIPVLHLDLLSFGNGGGDDTITIHRPIADMRRDLEQGLDLPLVDVRTDDPSPDYLRIAVLNNFTGTEWSNGGRTVIKDADGPLPAPQGLSPDVPYATYHYDVHVSDQFDATWLPTEFPISEIRAGEDWGYDASTMDFIALGDHDTRGESYSMTGIRPAYGTDGRFFTDSAAGDVSSEVQEVPDGIPTSVRALALRLTDRGTDDYQRALLLRDFFRRTGGFRYSVRKAPEGPVGQTLETFLTKGKDGRIGYCEQFASAMAIMARIVGIPARVAIGFLSPQRVGKDQWQYSTHDLHAWPELYFAGAGWVRFEPTPHPDAPADPAYSTVPVPDAAPGDGTSSAPPTQSARPSRTAASPSARPSPTHVPTAQPVPSHHPAATRRDQHAADIALGVLLALLALAVVVTAALAPRVVRSRQRRRRVAGSAEDVWAELRATALDLGLGWPGQRSPRQVARALETHLGDPERSAGMERPATGADRAPEAADALARIVETVELGRYARPGSAVAVAARTDLRAEAELVLTALACGADVRRRQTATWWPRSLWLSLDPPIRRVTSVTR